MAEEESNKKERKRTYIQGRCPCKWNGWSPSSRLSYTIPINITWSALPFSYSSSLPPFPKVKGGEEGIVETHDNEINNLHRVLRDHELVAWLGAPSFCVTSTTGI